LWLIFRIVPKIDNEEEQAECMLIFCKDEEEIRKWNALLIIPFQSLFPQNVKYSDSIEIVSDRKLDLWADKSPLVDYADLENLITNSEFLINPEEGYKIDTYSRLHEEKSALIDEYNKSRKENK